MTEDEQTPISPLKLLKPQGNRMMMNTPTSMKRKIVEDGKMLAKQGLSSVHKLRGLRDSRTNLSPNYHTNSDDVSKQYLNT